MRLSILGRLAGFTGMTLVTTAVAAISAALIVEKAVTPQLRDKAFCSAGYMDLAGETCLAEQMTALRLETEVTLEHMREDAAAQLAAAKAEVDAANEARDLAVHSLAGRMVFSEGPEIGGLTVIVGATYRDHTARTGLVRAICWGIHDNPGLDPRVTLAQMTADGVPAPVDVDAFERSALGVDMQEIEAARIACPWPGVS